MSEPNKINYRDLSPELQALINGAGATEGFMTEILKKYRKKDETIIEQDIDSAYRDALNSRINNIRIDLDNFISSLSVIPESNLSAEFLQRIANIELRLKALGNAKDFTADIQNLQSKFSELKTLVETTSLEAVNLKIDNVESNLLNKLNKLQDDLNTLSADQSDLAIQVSELKNNLRDQIAQTNNNIDIKINTLEGNITTKVDTAFNKRTPELLKDVENKIGSELQKASDAIDAKMENINANLNVQIESAKTQLKDGIDSSINNLKDQMDLMRNDLQDKMAKSDNALDAKIENKDTELREKMTEEHDKLQKKIDGFNTDIEEKFRNATGGITSRLDAAETRIGTLKETDDSLNSRLDAVELSLNGKRDNKIPIEKRDLSKDLVDKVDAITTLGQKVSDAIHGIDALPTIAPGSFLGINSDTKIVSKTLFWYVTTAGNDEQILKKAPGSADEIGIAINTGHIFKGKKQNDGSYKFVLQENYLDTHTECQNAFIISKVDNAIRGYIINKEIIGVVIRKESAPIKLTLGANQGDTVNCLDAMYKTIKIYAKDNDSTSGTYGKYIPADAYVSIAISDDSYVIHNYADQTLELAIMEQ